MRSAVALLCCCLFVIAASAQSGTPLAPFEPDAHTLLLYHFDEGTGTVARDASGHGYDGELLGATWAKGRYGGALRFDGKKASVFRKMTEAICGLRQITVECWFNQDNPEGRQFLMGKDVTYHFDLGDGQSTSLSLYNEGGAKPNAEGKPHQQVGCGGLSLRSNRWHHLAIEYDGSACTFIVDGVLRQRSPAAKDFSLGTNSRGLWIGCYVGMDYWFSGLIDEVRVSDCLRYDPDAKLTPGAKVFDMPTYQPKPVQVRPPVKTGVAKLDLTLLKRHGGDCAGWVYLRPPSGKPSVVGQYALCGVAAGATTKLSLDVSDELAGDGLYTLALVPTESAGYLALTAASLSDGGQVSASWTGRLESRRTFDPPLLVPLRRGQAATTTGTVALTPADTARLGGQLELSADNADGVPMLSGDGFAEYWVDLPRATAWRVYLRYASAARRPCDLVIDGQDLNRYTMAALDRTETGSPKDALWRHQGTTTLAPGLHWIRLQDRLPDIAGLRLDPVDSLPSGRVPWARSPVPSGDFAASARGWRPEPLHGQPERAALTTEPDALAYRAEFANTDPARLDAGDGVRLRLDGAWDLEPFGQLRFQWTGAGLGHVAALRLIDAKGDEKLLWQGRDRSTEPQAVVVPVSFEGMDVFDPGHVVAICLDLDEGNANPTQRTTCLGRLAGLRFDRRDTLAVPDGYATALATARTALAAWLKTGATKPTALASPGYRPWTKPVVPEEHPLYAATEPKPVTRATLGYGFHTTGARGIDAPTLDDFHRYYDFGDVCWPHIGLCPLRSRYPDAAAYQAALADMERKLNAVRDRGLYLFDIWGYVPDNAEYPWKAGPEHRAVLQRVFGDRFLGFDNGEQDGRYIGSYADRGTFTDRQGGWRDFVAWDQRVCADNADYMNATGSLNYSHYYGERGARMLGLETAQGLPSDTLMFAFLRGAGKQYGRLTYQATSVWNRFGWQVFGRRHTEGGNGYGSGPNKGCSLSLHKRLFLTGYLAGHSICGTETSQFTGDRLENGAPELSPLGAQHLALAKWTREHPDRGQQYTPIAFMLDFANGWNMPRHLYRGDKYKVWGKLPYAKGDHLIDNVFRMVWPGYEDASYLRGERGFLTPTPFGDSFDVITNRCHPDILRQYTAIMLLGDVEMTPELVANLTAFVEAGGDLLVDAARAAKLPAALTGVTLGAEAHGLVSHDLARGVTYDEQPFTYTRLTLAGAVAQVVADGGDPLLTVAARGKGRVVVCAADQWLTDRLTYREPSLVNMEPPYMLLRGLRAALDGYFGSFAPVSITPAGLGVQTVCHADGNRLTVGLVNNDLFADWQGTLEVRRGTVASATEQLSGQTLPAGRSIPIKVAAGEVAVVELRLR